MTLSVSVKSQWLYDFYLFLVILNLLVNKDFFQKPNMTTAGRQTIALSSHMVACQSSIASPTERQRQPEIIE